LANISIDVVFLSMMPLKIQSLFEFIDILDKNKVEYIEKYTPLCDEIKELENSRRSPREN